MDAVKLIEGGVYDCFYIYWNPAGMNRGYLDDDENEAEDEDDFPAGIRMGDGGVIMTDDDDFVEEFGEEVL